MAASGFIAFTAMAVGLEPLHTAAAVACLFFEDELLRGRDRYESFRRHFVDSL